MLKHKVFNIPVGSSYARVFGVAIERPHKIIVFDDEDPIYPIVLAVLDELNKADKKYTHDPMTHMKVGLKTIECEFVELEREVDRFQYATGHWDWMKKEAIQVAAMAFKFLRDIIGKKGGLNDKNKGAEGAEENNTLSGSE